MFLGLFFGIERENVAVKLILVEVSSVGQQEGNELIQEEQESDAEEGVHGSHQTTAWMRKKSRRQRQKITKVFCKTHFDLSCLMALLKIDQTTTTPRLNPKSF